jgi:hypothetical protein
LPKFELVYANSHVNVIGFAIETITGLVRMANMGLIFAARISKASSQKARAQHWTALSFS